MFNLFSYSFYIFLFILFIIFISIIVGIVVFINHNRNKNNMDLNQIKPKTNAKDFFLNLGAFGLLYTLVGNLIGLLFTVINTAYPKILNGYNYYGSSSISWPVATLIVLLPIFVLLMYFLEREYRVDPDMQNTLIHRGFTYITLFVSGCIIAGDLVTVVYYFIDGQELTTGFFLKVLVLLVISSGLFIYYISDLRKKLTRNSRIVWRIIAGVIVIGSIIWGFAVLGSPRTQRLIKYDEQKVNDLQSLSGQITSYHSNMGTLPNTLDEMANGNYYFPKVDPQSQKPYEYLKTSDTTYNLCAEFNKASDKKNTNVPIYVNYGIASWIHPIGHYCFNESVRPNNISPKPMPGV
jgi:hypothetical protein